MDILAARSFRVLLAVTLAANCVMPCYTLAYADESTDGGAIYERLRENKQERAGDGQAHQGSDFQGVLRHEAPGEASPGSEFSPAAGAGRIRPSAHVLVEASYSLVDSLIRFSSARAYADEPQEVGSVSQEEQEEIAGDAGGLEYSSGVGESNADAADGGAAAEGHGDYLGASEETGEDSSGLDGELDANGNFFERVLTSLEDITYLLGELVDYYRSGSFPGASDGIVALAGYGGSLTGGFGGAFSGGSGSGKSANLTDIVDSFTAAWGYGYNGTHVIIKNSPAYWLEWVYQYSWTTHTFPGENRATTKGFTETLWIISNLLYDSSTKRSVGYSTSKLLEEVRGQWGTGFGGTVVSYANSPYRFLQNLSDRTYFMRGSSSESGYVNWSFRSNNWATPTTGLPWLLSFIAEILNGTNNNVIGIGNDLSASYVLDGETYSNKSVAQILAHLINVQYWEAFDIKRVKENTSGLSTSMQLTGLPAGESTIAQIARYIHNNMVASYVIDGETYSNKSVAQMLAEVVNSSYWTSDKQSKIYDAFNALTLGPEGGRVSLYNIGNSIETIKNETRDLDNLLESVYDRLSALDALGVRLANIALAADDIRKGVNSSLQWYETLHSDLSMLRHGAADLLPGYADWTVWDFLQGIYFDMGNVVDLLKGLQQTLTAWGSRWDSQDLYLMEWAKRWDALDKSPADLSETNKLLGLLTADVASIRDKYVVGDSLSDMFGALVGDLQVPATAAAIDGIKGAMSTAFPFCLPSVVNLVLFGSVVADPQAPCWEFDIVGNPLVVDFSGFEDFAEVCRWTVRLLFAAALLLNTRKFVYGVGGAY